MNRIKLLSLFGLSISLLGCVSNSNSMNNIEEIPSVLTSLEMDDGSRLSIDGKRWFYKSVWHETDGKVDSGEIDVEKSNFIWNIDSYQFKPVEMFQNDMIQNGEQTSATIYRIRISGEGWDKPIVLSTFDNKKTTFCQDLFIVNKEFKVLGGFLKGETKTMIQNKEITLPDYSLVYFSPVSGKQIIENAFLGSEGKLLQFGDGNEYKFTMIWGHDIYTQHLLRGVILSNGSFIVNGYKIPKNVGINVGWTGEKILYFNIGLNYTGQERSDFHPVIRLKAANNKEYNFDCSTWIDCDPITGNITSGKIINEKIEINGKMTTIKEATYSFSDKGDKFENIIVE